MSDILQKKKGTMHETPQITPDQIEAAITSASPELVEALLQCLDIYDQIAVLAANRGSQQETAALEEETFSEQLAQAIQTAKIAGAAGSGVEAAPDLNDESGYSD